MIKNIKMNLKDLQDKKKVLSHLLELENKYQIYKNKGLNLDITRGKPSKEQLSLSNSILQNLTKEDVLKQNKDYRNYNLPQNLSGIPEAKKLFANLFDTKEENIIIGGNSSLNLMYDTIVKCLLHKLPYSNTNDKSWVFQEKIKFLCPVPGYDRHFNICENLNIEMIQVPLTGNGPNMDIVEKLVLEDETIKGIWCVPKYSNPTGEIYSDETIIRLAKMKTKAKDFRIFWDNAYAFHHLGKLDNILSIVDECKKNNNENRVFAYASTSKITFAGGGVSIIISSLDNINWYLNSLKNQSIGFDKINQLRHVKFLKNKEHTLKIMEKHCEILKPKFEIVNNILEKNLGQNNLFGTWTKPNGGYFFSFNSLPNLAKNIIKMSNDIGLKLTPAGSTFPYKKDLEDKNIRIAPSIPNIDELKTAIEIFSTIVKICTIKKYYL